MMLQAVKKAVSLPSDAREMIDTVFARHEIAFKPRLTSLVKCADGLNRLYVCEMDSSTTVEGVSDACRESLLSFVSLQRSSSFAVGLSAVVLMRSSLDPEGPGVRGIITAVSALAADGKFYTEVRVPSSTELGIPTYLDIPPVMLEGPAAPLKFIEDLVAGSVSRVEFERAYLASSEGERRAVDEKFIHSTLRVGNTESLLRRLH